MTLVDTERVLVIPTEHSHRLGHFQGFTTDIDRYLPDLLDHESLRYLPRSEMEEDPSFKQLIPYVVFRYDLAGQTELFQYCRGQGQGEARLRAKRSIGVGGHISTVDSDTSGSLTGTNVYEEGLRRELAEEVEIRTPYQGRIVGLINDDETEVGKVHLGIVHLFDVQQPHVQPKEEDILDAGFQRVEQILSALNEFESWSQIAVTALFG